MVINKKFFISGFRGIIHRAPNMDTLVALGAGASFGYSAVMTFMMLSAGEALAFYGSVLANWICSPVAAKLKANSASEISMKEVMVEGLLSIQAGENPRVIEEKLKSFIDPTARESLTSGGGEA